MKFSRRATLAALATPALAQAQAWPTRPLRVVVPFAPGGATDLIARLIADNLARPLGQQVAVENRAGAFGILGADAVAKAAPAGRAGKEATRKSKTASGGVASSGAAGGETAWLCGAGGAAAQPVRARPMIRTSGRCMRVSFG